jgi:hypothetical protein
LLCGVSVACAAIGVGCSSDTPDNDSDSPDSGPKADAAKDTGAQADAAKDSGTSGKDAGTDADTPELDAGTDGSTTSDAGTDAAIPDSGPQDAGTDAAVPDSGPQDAGTDSGPQDAGTDATTPDSGPGDSGTDTGTDAGPVVSFDNPLQIDVSAVLNANTIVTTTPLNGFGLAWMDRTNFDFMTSSKAKQLNANGLGLPDDAVFPAVGTTHPTVKLHWSDTANQNNSRVATDGTPFSFAVPQALYTQLQVYGLATEGATTISVLVTYADNTTSTVSLAVPDWFNDAVAPQFTLIDGLDRIKDGTTFTAAKNPAVFGLNVNPDKTKPIKLVTITNTTATNPTAFFVFYGATAW